MKQTLRRILVLVVACAACSLVTYRIAYRSGYRQGSFTGLTCGDFTESLISLVSLQKLRGGNILDATRYMETICFGRANAFFKFSTSNTGKANPWVKPDGLLQPPGVEMTRELAKELSVYRAVYRTNSADWDGAETNLEAQIATIKSDGYQTWARIVVTN